MFTLSCRDCKFSFDSRYKHRLSCDNCTQLRMTKQRNCSICTNMIECEPCLNSKTIINYVCGECSLIKKTFFDDPSNDHKILNLPKPRELTEYDFLSPIVKNIIDVVLNEKTDENVQTNTMSVSPPIKKSKMVTACCDEMELISKMSLDEIIKYIDNKFINFEFIPTKNIKKEIYDLRTFFIVFSTFILTKNK